MEPEGTRGSLLHFDAGLVRAPALGQAGRIRQASNALRSCAGLTGFDRNGRPLARTVSGTITRPSCW